MFLGKYITCKRCNVIVVYIYICFLKVFHGLMCSYHAFCMKFVCSLCAVYMQFKYPPYNFKLNPGGADL